MMQIFDFEDEFRYDETSSDYEGHEEPEVDDVEDDVDDDVDDVELFAMDTYTCLLGKGNKGKVTTEIKRHSKRHSKSKAHAPANKSRTG